MAPFLHPFVVALLFSSSASSSAVPNTTPGGATTAAPPSTFTRPPLFTSNGNSRKLLFDETWNMSMHPDQARSYLMTPETWISIVPDSENGFVTENDAAKTGEKGEWSLTTNDGTHLLCRNTQINDDCRNNDLYYLSYNVLVTFQDGTQFTIDIEYDILHGTITRSVFDVETLNLKTKLLKPLIRTPLIEMMQEENRRLRKRMNE